MGVKVPIAISDSTYARAVAIPVYHADTKNKSNWLFKQNGDGTGITRNCVRASSRKGIAGFRSRHTGCGRIAGYGFLFCLAGKRCRGGSTQPGARGICRGLKPVFPFVFSFFDIYYHCTQFSYAFTAVTSFLFF